MPLENVLAHERIWPGAASNPVPVAALVVHARCCCWEFVRVGLVILGCGVSSHCLSTSPTRTVLAHRSRVCLSLWTNVFPRLSLQGDYPLLCLVQVSLVEFQENLYDPLSFEYRAMVQLLAKEYQTLARAYALTWALSNCNAVSGSTVAFSPLFVLSRLHLLSLYPCTYLKKR